MDETMLSRVFEPFFTTRAATGGRGIGLASSRESIEAMGGQLVLASVRGTGTTARVSLPIEVQPC
jgi:signal transduction histidine kinase